MPTNIKPKNPQRFIEEFSSILNRNYEDVCFFLYGSVLRDDFIEGSSDIDGGLIFDCDVVTPKKKIRGISEVLSELKTKHGLKLEFNLTDRVTNRDGRFMSYTDDYTDYLKTEARVLSETDFLYEMNGINYRHSSLHSVSFNLREQRNNLLIIGKDSEKKFTRIKDALSISLEKIRGLPKKLIFLQTGDWVFNKEESSEALKEILPDYEQDFLRYALELRREPFLLGDFKEEEITDLYEKSITETEKMIREYIQRFPSISWRESRSDEIIKKLFEYDFERGVYLQNAGRY